MFALGTVVVEALCVVNDAMRELDTFAIEHSWGLQDGVPVIALAWFVGGFVFASQPLPTKIRNMLQLTGASLLAARIIVIYLRMGNARLLRVALPSTTLSFALGGVVAIGLRSAMPLTELARQLEELETSLHSSQHTWASVLGELSDLKHQSWRQHVDQQQSSQQPQQQQDLPTAEAALSPSLPHSKAYLNSSQRTCVICLQRPYTHAYSPCMHRCVCATCRDTWPDVCPLCRAPATDCVRIFDG